MDSNELRKHIYKLRFEKHTFNQIGDILDISETKVKSLFYYKPKIFKSKPGPRKLIDNRQHVVIKRCVEKMNKDGMNVTCNKLINETKFDISRRTMNNWLIKNDYKYTKVVQKIILSKEQKI